jgi:hypothetical protein
MADRELMHRIRHRSIQERDLRGTPMTTMASSPDENQAERDSGTRGLTFRIGRYRPEGTT